MGRSVCSMWKLPDNKCPAVLRLWHGRMRQLGFVAVCSGLSGFVAARLVQVLYGRIGRARYGQVGCVMLRWALAG